MLVFPIPSTVLRLFNTPLGELEASKQYRQLPEGTRCLADRHTHWRWPQTIPIFSLPPLSDSFYFREVWFLTFSRRGVCSMLSSSLFPGFQPIIGRTTIFVPDSYHTLFLIDSRRPQGNLSERTTRFFNSAECGPTDKERVRERFG